MQKLLEEYLKGDRQWPRRHRIAFAQHMLTQSEKWGRDYRLFWTAVLKANGVKS